MKTFRISPLHLLLGATLLLGQTSCNQLAKVATSGQEGYEKPRTGGQAGKPNGGVGSAGGSGGGNNVPVVGPVTEVTLNYTAPPLPVQNKYAANVRYGSYAQDQFDIFLPNGSQPAPLVIFIHGGGFRNGDRRAFYQKFPEEIKAWLNNGYAAATISYRFIQDGPNGVMNSLADIRRCIQFIKYNAQALGIDKERIGCMGVSAGAGSSLWLAVHDDMADPTSSDPIARESTRIRAAAAINTQSSYDLFAWDAIFDKAFKVRPTENARLQQEMVAFYGAKSYSSLKSDPSIVALRKDLNMLAMMDTKDPELWLMCDNANEFPDKQGILLHHPLHVQALNDAAKNGGTRASALANGVGLKPAKQESLADFFLRALK
jgi:Carboxylesterase family